MNGEYMSFSLPLVNLEECNIEDKATEVDMFLVQGAVTREDKLPELRQRILT
jgi:coenzyme F420-reducing hydrogenase gamma subunit